MTISFAEWCHRVMFIYFGYIIKFINTFTFLKGIIVKNVNYILIFKYIYKKMENSLYKIKKKILKKKFFCGPLDDTWQMADKTRNYLNAAPNNYLCFTPNLKISLP